MNIHTLASIKGDRGQQAEVNAWWVAVLVAMIAAIPPLVTGLYDRQADVESRKASAELYKSALATADQAERKKRIEFLMKAKLVDDNPDIASMPEEKIPQWQAE